MALTEWMKFPGPPLPKAVKPKKARRSSKRFVVELTPQEFVMLIESAGSDDCLDWCEECGAPMDINDPARSTAEDFSGCWYVLTGDEKDRAHCKRNFGELIKRARVYVDDSAALPTETPCNYSKKSA